MRPALPLAAVMLLSCCSVKEDRSECPCRVEIYPDPARAGIAVDMTFRDAGSGVDIVSYQDRRPMPGGCLYQGELPRKRLRLAVHNGIAECLTKGPCIYVSEGGQMDSVYVYGTLLDASGAESLRDTVRLCKEFATLQILTSEPAFADVFAFRIRGRGCGVDLSDPSGVLEGDFSCMFSGGVRIPRQDPGALLLDIVSLSDGETAATLPLGEYLEKSGYDWKAPSLEDISMDLDFSRCVVSILVCDWEECSLFTFTI